MSQLEDIVRRYYAAFNARDFAAYDSLFTKDCAVQAPGVDARGIEGVREFDRNWIRIFPEAKIESMRMTTAGKLVATGNWFDAGPQREALVTPHGSLPAKGKVLSAPYCSLFQIEDGKIALQRLLYEAEFIPAQLA